MAGTPSNPSHRSDHRDRADPVLRDRPPGPAVPGGGRRPHRRHRRARHRQRRQGRAGGHRLLPAHRRRRGADVRGRARSPARSSAGKAGRPTRPSSPPGSSTGRCGPSFADGYRNETQVVVTVLGADQENPHDVLAINAASAALMLSGIPFEGPIGAVRIAYTAEGEWIPHPDLPGGRRLDLRAGRRRPPARRRRRRHHDGRGRRHRGGLELLRGRRAQGHRGGHRRRPRGVQDLDPGVDRPAAPAGRRGRRRTTRIAYVPQVDYGDDVCRAGGRGRHRAGSTSVTTITAKAERNAATDEATAAIVAELAGEFEGREREIKAAVRSLTKKLVRKRIADEGVRIDGRGPDRHPAAVGRGGRHPDGPRFGPLPAGRDPGAQRHHARACRAWTSCSTPSASTTRSATCTTTTCRRTPTARPAGSAAPSGARSATACSPSGPCCRWCPRSRSSPTPCASCPRCCPRTARRRWRRCARRRCR